MAIVWRDEYRVGNELIDADHRYLFCLVNTVDLAVRDDDREILESALNELTDYARYHFAREERIQYAAGFPGYLDHKLAHYRLMQNLEDACAHIRDASGLERGTQQGELQALLRQWLLEHVLQEDMQMRPYLEKLPKSFE